MTKPGKVFVLPESTSHRPVIIEPSLCTGCNRCVTVCPSDVFLPAETKGRPPHVVYPGECWYEGSCVLACPIPGAIRLELPLSQRVRWKRRERS